MKIKATLGLIILLGIILRFWNIDAISLWHDEAFSALLIKYPWNEMLYRIELDVHPPFYYILLRLWHYIFSDSVFALRSFSAFFSIISIPLAYAFISRTFKSSRAALIAALFIAVNPFQIYYVSEARMYTLGCFLVVLSLYTFSRFEAYKKLSKHQATWAVLFGLSCGAAALTHYYLLFTISCICFYALLSTIFKYKFEFKRASVLLGSFIITGLLFAVYLPTTLDQIKQVSNGYWIPALTRWSMPEAIWMLFTSLPLNSSFLYSKLTYLGATILLLFILFRFLRTNHQTEKWLLLLCFIAPFLGSSVFGLIAKLKGSNTSVFLVRYFVYASPALCMILALYLNSIRNKITRNFFVIGYSLLSVFSIYYFWQSQNLSQSPGMKGAALYLKEQKQINDKLFIASSSEFFNFKYYNSQELTKTGLHPLVFTSGRTDIKDIEHYSGTAILTNEELLPSFQHSAVPGDTVWLLWTNGFWSTKPELPTNWQQLDEKVFPDVKPVPGTNIYVDRYLIK